MKRNVSLSYALGGEAVISAHLQQLALTHSYQCGASMCDVSMCMSVQVHLPVESRSVSAVFYHFLHYHPFTFIYFCESRGGNWGNMNIYICHSTQKGNRGQFWRVTFFPLCEIHYQSPDVFLLCLWSAKAWAPLFCREGRLLAMMFCITPRPKSVVPNNHGLLKLRVFV